MNKGDLAAPHAGQGSQWEGTGYVPGSEALIIVRRSAIERALNACAIARAKAPADILRRELAEAKPVPPGVLEAWREAIRSWVRDHPDDCEDLMDKVLAQFRQSGHGAKPEGHASFQRPDVHEPESGVKP